MNKLIVWVQACPGLLDRSVRAALHAAARTDTGRHTAPTNRRRIVATMTFVFREELDPSEKDTELWDTATALGLNVNTVPDLYPGVGGELEIHGSPATLAQLVAVSARNDIPAKPTRLIYEHDEADLVDSLEWPPETELDLVE